VKRDVPCEESQFWPACNFMHASSILLLLWVHNHKQGSRAREETTQRGQVVRNLMRAVCCSMDQGHFLGLCLLGRLRACIAQ
jgi:hypothetical protein